MSGKSTAQQRAANAQADNIVDMREHHVGIPHNQEIESDPKAINRNKRVAPESEAASQGPEELQFRSGGGRGVKGHTGSGKGPLDHQNPNV